MVSVEHGNSIPVANLPDFSSEFRPTCDAFRQDAPEIIEKNLRKLTLGILLPCSGDFRCFPALSRRTSSTWVVFLFLLIKTMRFK